jgi:hypothetical protein
VGFTVCVPPVSGNGYELPSDPVIVTVVAFAAVTDNIEVPPAATVVGLAEILSEGLAFVILPLTPPHPTATSKGPNAQNMRGTNRRRSRDCCGTGKAFPVLSFYRGAEVSCPAAIRAQFSPDHRRRPMEKLIR